ncbi:MAG TPA: cytochrome b, partial [Pseudonocardia sp.]
MSSLTTPTTTRKALVEKSGQALDELDQRFHPAAGMRRQFNKVFPTHWSFMLGEIALYSFLVLLLTGTWLALFFDPSMQEVTYNGAFDNLRGVPMSRAFESALHISFDVRGGLFVRQVHHWAALLFLAAMCVHMFRTFFTGAFRKPRETNWVIGVVLILIGMFEGFSGYSLPDDLLSGTGLRIGSGITLSVPVMGTWVHWALFGGEFPGTEIIPRLYIVHVLLLPGILLALIGVHVGLVWYQKHTQFPGPGRTEKNVVGVRILPTFAAKGGAFFAVAVGVMGLMGGLFQINPIWNFGPYN